MREDQENMLWEGDGGIVPPSPSLCDEPKLRQKWLTEEEQKRLLEAVQTPLEAMIVHLALKLGLSMTEIQSVRVQDFDELRYEIHIQGKRTRSVPLHVDTQSIFNKWLKVRTELMLDAMTDNPGIVVPNNLLVYYNPAWKFGTYSKVGMARILKELVKRAGIYPNCGFHTLRRTFVKTAHQKGIDAENIAKLLGYRDVKPILWLIHM